MFTKIFYINLDRRPDRDEHMKSELGKLNFNCEIERVSAVDGKLLDLNSVKELLTRKAFKTASNPPKYVLSETMTKGAVGCALSHRKVCLNILNGNHEHVLVLEDDIYLHENFNDKIKEYINNAPPDYDIVYLGYHCNPKGKIINEYYKKPTENIYGTFGFIFNKNAAKKLVDMFPIDKQIDSEIEKIYPYINVYFLCEDKKLIHSEGSILSNFGTDIQSVNVENNSIIKKIIKKIIDTIIKIKQKIKNKKL
jgi:GR25 family glycosyltransferase involved in LPS biosynthesis